MVNVLFLGRKYFGIIEKTFMAHQHFGGETDVIEESRKNHCNAACMQFALLH